MKPYVYLYIEDFSIAENVDVLSLPKIRKVITICDVLNGKILARRDMFARKLKKFLCHPLGWMRA